MRLIDLDPAFLRRQQAGDRELWDHVDTLAEAHGMRFDCPKCTLDDSHMIVCWFEDRVPNGVLPGPGRWNPTGSTFADLSFVPGKRSHSVALTSGCKAHFFITAGAIIIA